MTPTPTTLAHVPNPEVPARASRRTYTAHYKAQIVAEYDSLDAAGRGALLRRHGLYTSHITNWRKLRTRSEEHTSELQSQSNLVCRLLLEKKNTNQEQ